MSGGTGINTVYNQFSKNTKDAIILAVVVSASDTKASLLSAYAAKGCVPEFPIILNGQGGKSCAQLFGQSTTGGPSWVTHPDREYTSTSYTASTLTININKALADDCGGTAIDLSKIATGMQPFSMHNGTINFAIPEGSSGFIQFELFNLAGAKIFSTQEYFTERGNHSIPVQSLTHGKILATGSYILQMKTESSFFRTVAFVK